MLQRQCQRSVRGEICRLAQLRRSGEAVVRRRATSRLPADARQSRHVYPFRTREDFKARQNRLQNIRTCRFAGIFYESPLTGPNRWPLPYHPGTGRGKRGHGRDSRARKRRKPHRDLTRRPVTRAWTRVRRACVRISFARFVCEGVVTSSRTSPLAAAASSSASSRRRHAPKEYAPRASSVASLECSALARPRFAPNSSVYRPSQRTSASPGRVRERPLNGLD